MTLELYAAVSSFMVLVFSGVTPKPEPAIVATGMFQLQFVKISAPLISLFFCLIEKFNVFHLSSFKPWRWNGSRDSSGLSVGRNVV